MKFKDVKYGYPFLYQGKLYLKQIQPTAYDKSGMKPTQNAFCVTDNSTKFFTDEEVDVS